MDAAGSVGVIVRRWVVLLGYAVLVYGLLPYGPAIGRAVTQSGPGRWVLGPGAGWIVGLGAVLVARRLWRRGVSGSVWALAVVTAAGYAGSLSWLKAIRLERVHLPEYGIAVWLAWRAVSATFGDGARSYVLAAVIAALIGWGDELVQAVTPGRVYDVRDVAANALGAVLGAMVIAVWRSGPPTGGSS